MKDAPPAPDQEADPWLTGPLEVGVWSDTAQGKRTDVHEVADMIIEGRTLTEVAEAYPVSYIRLNRGISALRNLRKPDPHPEGVHVYLLYGPPGCGKTRRVRENADGTLWCAPVGDPMQWFDGYDGDDNALFDDFDGKMSHVPLSRLLQVLDRYPISVPVKGGFRWFHPKRIYVTTNYHPCEWYDWGERLPQFGALSRRFSSVAYWPTGCDSGDTPTVVFRDEPGWQPFWDRQY